MERGATELTPALARRMGQLWAARQYAKPPAFGWRPLLLDALTLPEGPTGPSFYTMRQRRRQWLASMHRRVAP